MGIFTRSTTPAEVLANIDSLLLRLHRGEQGDGIQERLAILARDAGLSEKQLFDRQKAAVERKAAETRAKALKERPPFPAGEGVILREHVTTNRYLTWTRGELREAIAVDEILNGDTPAPGLTTTKLFRAPADDEVQFDYLCELLVKLADGELQPGKVLLLKTGEPTGASRLQTVDSENAVAGPRLAACQFVRHPRQSAAKFAAAKKQLEAELAKNGHTDMSSAKRPAMAGASSDSRW